MFAGFSAERWDLDPAPKTWALKVFPLVHARSLQEAPFHVCPVCVLILVLLQSEGQAGYLLDAECQL